MYKGNFNSSLQKSAYNQKNIRIMKALIKLAVIITVAGLLTLALGGSFWAWSIGLLFGRFIIQLALTVSLAIIIYVLIYALLIGGVIWILIF